MTLEEHCRLTGLLKEARHAYHLLMTGQSAKVVVDGTDGTRVEFTSVNRAALYQYIMDLERQLAPATLGSARTLGPVRFTF